MVYYRSAAGGVCKGLVVILVTGLLPYDSGKTFVGRSLLKYFRGVGYSAIAYKPIAAHNAWFQLETVEKSTELGVLVGHDAYLYWKDMGGEVAIEEINPIDILTVPMDFSILPSNIRSYFSMLESFLSQACIMRISCFKTNRTITKHYVNVEHVRKAVSTLRPKLIELARKLKPQPKPVTYEQMVELTNSPEPITCADIQLERLTRKYEVVIVESFNNAATPTPLSVKNADKVLVVAPGKALIYDGRKYLEALKILEETLGNKIAYTTVTRSVVELLKPQNYMRIHPCSKPSDKALESIEELLK